MWPLRVVFGVWLFNLAVVVELPGTTLLRGPYLQTATSTSIIVRWRTDAQVAGTVWYGPQTNDLPLSAGETVATNEHIVQLTGLAPATSYYYAIGSAGETLAQGSQCQFTTSPIPGQAVPTRVWVIGDSGGYSSGWTNVVSMRDAYATYTGARRTDLWLLLGDNAYEDGLDMEYQLNFFNVFPAMAQQVACWSTLGNHDVSAVGPGQQLPYLALFSFPTNGETGGVASGREEYYSFNYGNTHFVCLDSTTQSRATNGPMADWLQADLASNTNQWLVAFWHHPPYTKGTHNSDTETELIEMRQNIVSILEGAGVDLVLTAHSHAYERSYLLQGHYGFSSSLQPTMVLDQGSGRENETGAYLKPVAGPLANRGTVYVVLGNSSELAGWRYGHHPAMFTDELSVGSLVLDINSNRLDGLYLRNTGEVGDYFTLLKSEPAPFRICSFALSQGKIIARWKSVAGETYRVEQAENLQSPDWQPVGDTVVASGVTTSRTNTLPTGTSALYYRVAQLAP